MEKSEQIGYNCRMTQTFRALLQGNQLKWLEEVPASLSSQTAVRVRVMLDAQEATEDETERQQKVLRLLNELAASHAFSDIEDPSAWQQEIRTDRPLPDRN